MHIPSVGDHCSHLDDWLRHLPLIFSFIIPRNFSRQLDKTSLLFWNQDTQCWDIKCNTGQAKLYSPSFYTLWHCESFPLLTLDLLITNPFKRALTLTPDLQYRLLRPHEENIQVPVRKYMILKCGIVFLHWSSCSSPKQYLNAVIKFSRFCSSCQ